MGIWGDKSKNSTDAPLISPNLIELLHNIDEEFLIIAPGEVVVASSPGVAALGVVKESTVTSFPLLNLIRTSRRNKERLEETIELPRGPIGGGTRELLVRVAEIINLSQLQDVDPLKNAAIWNLSSVVRDAIDESRLAADKRQIEIVFQEIDPCFALGDRSQLLMAVSNLIENAINYSSSGTRVGISISHNGSLSEISVTDQGVGIPERDLERIFERFYRVDPARSRETGGTGLGLSIVKHVAANHGGDITVWSLEGHGSTFTIRLPYLSDENDQSSKGGAE